jgi:phosphoenolpyruvate carboxykinase (GTP)
MVERIHGEARDPEETPIGWIPRPEQLDTEGLAVTREALTTALSVDRGEWQQALVDLGDFYGQFGPRLPAPIAATLARTRQTLGG